MKPENKEVRKVAQRDGKDTQKRTPFMKKAVMVSLLAGGLAAACTDVNINTGWYDPYAPDGGAQVCIVDCEVREGVLREEGNTAGSNTMQVGNATLRFKGLVDEGPTKAATLELDGCDAKAEHNFLPGDTSTLTINGESVDVSLDDMRYDGAGLLLRVTAVPVTSACMGPEADAGSGGDGGSG